MEKLIQKIHNERNRLNSIEFDTTDINFINKFNADIKSLSECDYLEITKLLYMMIKDVSLKEASKEVELIQNIVSDIIEKDFDYIINLLNIFLLIKEKYNIENWTLSTLLRLKTLNPAELAIKQLFKLYTKKYGNEEVETTLKWLTTYELAEILAFSANAKIANQNLKSTPSEVEKQTETQGEFMSPSEKRKINDKIVKEINSDYLKCISNDFADVLNNLKVYQKRKNDELKYQEKDVKNQLRKLALLEQDLEKRSLTLEKLKNYNLSPTIINQAIIHFINSRNELYKKTYSDLQKTLNKSTDSYEDILRKYNKDFNKLTEEEQEYLTTSIKKEHLDKAFIEAPFLKNISEESECFVHLLSLPIETLKTLNILIFRNKISLEFVLRNGYKLTSESVKVLEANIVLISETLKINLENVESYNDNLMLSLNKELVNLLIDYGIDFKNKDIKYFEILEDPNIINLIDQFIEIGLLDTIQINPDLLNNQSYNILKRIIIMQELGIDYLTEEAILTKAATKGIDFYLGDDNLDDYIGANSINFVDESMNKVLSSNNNLEYLLPDEISYIENYKINNYVYYIAGNYFSRIKVLRCLKTLIDNDFKNYNMMLFNSLIYNYPKHLDIETIEEIKNICKNSKQLIK